MRIIKERFYFYYLNYKTKYSLKMSFKSKEIKRFKRNKQEGIIFKNSQNFVKMECIEYF